VNHTVMRLRDIRTHGDSPCMYKYSSFPIKKGVHKDDSKL